MKIDSFDPTFHKIIKEIAHMYDIEFNSIADNRLIELTKKNLHRRIIGYNFDLNDSAAWAIAKYKDLASSMFKIYDIPHVEHKIFRNPASFSNGDPNWFEMMDFARKYNYDIVCKPNSGSLGAGVTHIKTQTQLEEAALNMFSKQTSLVLSPYYEILNETRLVVLCNECVVIFEKERPILQGDGEKTLLDLFMDFASSFDTLNEFLEFIKSSEVTSDGTKLMNNILLVGEKVYLHWKHNSSKASKYILRTESSLENFAISMAKVLNLNFASIDIIDTNSGSKILEVNTGIDLRKLYERHYDVVKDVYSKAVQKMFQI